VIDYLFARMRDAPCSEIIVVTRPEKVDLIHHARQQGATVILGYPASVAASILTGVRGLDRDDIVLFGFPDTIWYPRDGFRRLVAAAHGDAITLGLFHTAEPERSDVVTVLDTGEIIRIEVKPALAASNRIWGCGVARTQRLAGLAGVDEPGTYFNTLCSSGMVRGVKLGSFLDIGTKDMLRALENSGARGM
jgi:hypothetical protein